MVGVLLFAALTPGWLLCCARAEEPSSTGGRAVLVYTRTAGYTHDSIAVGVEMFQSLGDEHGFAVIATDDGSTFTPDTLAQIDAVVFLNTTGDVLDQPQQAAMEAFIRGGGGFVGVHSAADTEYDWSWYGRLVGAYFKRHPRTQPATLHVVDAQHPATAHLPETWSRTDEWYDFRNPPAEGVRVLLRLAESTYEGGTMGTNHPAAWCHEFDGGRSFYTALGHTPASYTEQAFVEHAWGGLRWAAGWDTAD